MGYSSRQDHEADQAKRQAEQQAKAALREKFNESERILDLLRTQGATELKEATDGEIQTWAKTNQISTT